MLKSNRSVRKNNVPPRFLVFFPFQKIATISNKTISMTDISSTVDNLNKVKVDIHNISTKIQLDVEKMNSNKTLSSAIADTV